MGLESRIRILQALPESKKLPIPKGHESDQQILVGCLMVILFIEISVFTLARKTIHSIIDLVLGERESLILVVSNSYSKPDSVQEVSRQQNDVGYMGMSPTDRRWFFFWR